MMKKARKSQKNGGKKMDVVAGISVMYYYVLLIVAWKDSTYILRLWNYTLE